MNNPLLLDKKNRAMYDALVDMNSTDIVNDFENWRTKKHKVEVMMKAEGKCIRKGWRCWFLNHNNWINVDFAERVSL